MLQPHLNAHNAAIMFLLNRDSFVEPTMQIATSYTGVFCVRVFSFLLACGRFVLMLNHFVYFGTHLVIINAVAIVLTL